MYRTNSYAVNFKSTRRLKIREFLVFSYITLGGNFKSTHPKFSVIKNHKHFARAVGALHLKSFFLSLRVDLNFLPVRI